MARVLLLAAVLMAAHGGWTDASAQHSTDPQSTPREIPATPDGAPTAPDDTPAVPDDDLASPTVKLGVAGVYLCEGTNPDGSPYHGLVEIAAIDSTYLVHWVLANGTEVLGVGIVRSGILSVSYFGGTPAVAVYQIDGDRLLGEWTMGGAEGRVYSETLTKMHEKPAQVKPREQRPREPKKQPPAQARPIRGVKSA